MHFNDLHTWGDLAAILTFVGLLIGYVRYEIGLNLKKRELEKYLLEEKQRVQVEDANKSPADRRRGQFSVIHIMADRGMTADEIVQASFRSKKIARFVRPGAGDNIARDLLFQSTE